MTENGIALCVLLAEVVDVELFSIFPVKSQYFGQNGAMWLNLLGHPGRWRRLNLFVLTIRTSLDIGEVLANILGELKCAWICFTEPRLHLIENLRMVSTPRILVFLLGLTFVAKPFLWQGAIFHGRINALNVKGTNAAIATYEISIPTTRAAVLVVLIFFLWTQP